MENGLTATSGNLPATQTRNPFEDYGEAGSGGGHIVGKLLKFSKGEYLAGQHGDEIPKKTQLTAVMDSLLVGWVKWEESRPIDQRMVQIVKGEKPSKRSELGDDDKSKWEIDDNGQQRDPWQLTNYIVFVDVNNEVFTFTTTSFGGRGAVGELCKAYGKNMRQKPDDYPIISLDVGSYKHKDKKFGKIFVPKLEIVGWINKAPYDRIAGNASAQAAEDSAAREAADTSIPFDQAAQGKADKAKGGKAQPRF